jgi:hypothetical protein
MPRGIRRGEAFSGSIMPHPLLQRWKRAGFYSLGLGTDGVYYFVTDAAARKSLHALIVLMGQIEYESSISIALEDEPTHVDPVLRHQYKPRWRSGCLKVTGGSHLSTITMKIETEEFVFPRKQLEKIFSQPNLGHEEVYLRIPQRFSIW